MFLRSGFAASRSSASIQCSQLLQRNVLRECPVRLIPQIPESKQVDTPMKDCTEKPTARRSIKYDMSSNVTSQRMCEEICHLMSMEEVNKPALRIVIPSGNDNNIFHFILLPMRQQLTSLKIFAKRIGSQWTMHCLYKKSSRTKCCITSLTTWLAK